jgi:Reverse transcriptase (RNA-dependent DNA polymerase)
MKEGELNNNLEFAEMIQPPNEETHQTESVNTQTQTNRNTNIQNNSTNTNMNIIQTNQNSFNIITNNQVEENTTNEIRQKNNINTTGEIAEETVMDMELQIDDPDIMNTDDLEIEQALMEVAEEYVENDLGEDTLLNQDKGDSIYTKYKNSMRIYTQNANGLKAPGTSKWKACLDIFEEFQCDIVGLHETNTNWNHNDIRNQFQKILTTKFRNSSLDVSRTNQKYKRAFLPGGAAMATIGKWNSKISGRIYDEYNMSRWIGITYQVTSTKKLHVITAYRPCPNNNRTKITSLATYTQQKCMLIKRGLPDACPRTQFTIDIIQEIQKLRQSPDDYVVLALDANNPNYNENYGLQDIMTQCNLVDAYIETHQDHSDFPTYQRGTKRIDYILCSPNTLNFIDRIGYVRFNEGIDSDHRAVFMDLSETILENNCIAQTKKLRLVGTNSTNMEGERYIRHLHKTLICHNIFQRLQTIADTDISKLTEEDKDELMNRINVIDKTVTEQMLSAEKQTCSKKDAALWSPDLYQSNLRIQYLIVWIRSRRQGTCALSKLNKIWEKMNLDSRNKIRNGTNTLKTRLKHEIQEHRIILLKHREIRIAYLQAKLDDLNERETNKAKQQTLKSLIIRERKRANFATIRKVFKSGKGKGITSVEVPNENNTGMRRIAEPVEFETTLINKNVNHFGQAKDTPFALHPIQQWFEYEGTNSKVIQLLNNKEIPKEVQNYPKYVREIIEKLGDGNKLKDLREDITYEEYIRGFEKWNERTTTSPSGRHLGHYKLLIRLQVYDESNNNINLSQQILNVYYTIATTTAKLGRSLERWCNVTTMMIEKVKGCSRIDKLRVIHLYEADYNLLLKIMWARKGVWYAHNKDALADGQAGSRPGRRAIEVVVKKEMKYLYSRLTRTPLATIDNDAKSCFDRIMCNLGMAVSGYFGIPICYRKMQANTLKNTTFRIRTAMGDSERTYTHTEDTPIHGTGQGSCASPAIWLFISSFIMMILEKEANGMEVHDILKEKDSIIQWIEGFVDDTSLFVNNGFEDTDIVNLKNKLKEDGTWWAGLLPATGGKLELSKCFFYLLTWKYDKKGNPIAELMQEQHDNENGIILEHDIENQVEIQQKDISL